MLTSSDLALLIPLVFFAAYAIWVTAEAVRLHDELDTEEKCHQMTREALDNERRSNRTYRKALQFYALDENWTPDNRSLSKMAADQGQTAQLALGDFFLAPNADCMAPILELPEGQSPGKYFFLLGPK